VARGDLAGPQKGAQAQGQTLFFLDDSGCYPWPSVVRTYAPRGQTPILRAWGTREHLLAISAISPEGKRSCHHPDGAINSAAGGALPEHLLREVSGRVIILDGPPIPHRQAMKAFLGKGAAQRLHLERLPAYAPELNPGEGLCAQLKDVERHYLYGFNLTHLRHDRRDAVKRVR
jgi:transposase